MHQDSDNYRVVEVLVGQGPYIAQSFSGRLLAKEQLSGSDTLQMTIYDIYKTATGKLVSHVQTTPSWGNGIAGVSQRDAVMPDWWGSWADAWRMWGTYWRTWATWHGEYRLDVYGSLEELRPHISSSLYSVVAQQLAGADAVALDI